MLGRGSSAVFWAGNLGSSHEHRNTVADSNEIREPIARPMRSVPNDTQVDLFGVASSSPSAQRKPRKVGFHDPDPHDLSIGLQPLSVYLEEIGLSYVFELRTLLRELDWSAFEDRYELTGRRPYAPAVIVGLILFGIMDGVSSLRGVERLARLNVAAMWLTGGICPDHACIGRFIQRHSETLTTTFFEDLTASILQRMGSKSHFVAGDGTTIFAAGSRYKTLRIEAAVEAARVSEDAALADPEDEGLEREAERTRAVADAAEARAEARRAAGLKRETTQVTATEPDAAVLKTKSRLVAPAYVASVLANADRVIVGQHVHSTSEHAALKPMLEQADRLTKNEIETLAVDGSYARRPVATWAVENDLDLLSPPPSRRTAGFSKQDFEYDDKRRGYVCPAGTFLRRRGRGKDKRRGAEFTNYAVKGSVCQACPLLDKCMPGRKSRRGRTIRRYTTDPAMDALRTVMKQPGAAERYRKRIVMVEPVFAELKGAQGLTRFRRFGRTKVAVELALHACAYNLRRLRARLRAAIRAASVALTAFMGAFWWPRTPSHEIS